MKSGRVRELKVLSDYAKRRDFQDESAPRRREKRFTRFTRFRVAGKEKS